MTLELQDLTICLRDRTLVRNLSARIAAGQVLAVMGESGSGKSTLLAWLCGTLGAPFAASGRVVLDGRDITHLPIEQRRMAILFQDDLLFPHMSVLDNLLFAVPPGMMRSRVQRAEHALAGAELAGYGARRPHELSGGQRARVSLLRALLSQPAAMLLDEPFSRLDAALRARFREWVWATLAEQGVPAVLVTHDPADVPAAAQCIDLGRTMTGDSV